MNQMRFNLKLLNANFQLALSCSSSSNRNEEVFIDTNSLSSFEKNFSLIELFTEPRKDSSEIPPRHSTAWNSVNFYNSITNRKSSKIDGF